MVAFVHLYEQPALRARFGTQYEQYTHAVPGWLARLHPFHPTDHPDRPLQTESSQVRLARECQGS
jgi:hypothetical protein